jgi:hypothetical protein
MPAATNAPRATAERALIMTVPCHGPLRPFIDGPLVSSAGFRMASPVRKTVSSRRSFVSSPPGGRNIVGSRRRRGDPAGGSGTLAIKIPVGARNLPACPCCPPCRRSWCISPSAMKAWMFSGLRADGRRSGLGVGWDRWSGAATSRRPRRSLAIAHAAARWLHPCVILGRGLAKYRAVRKTAA